MSLTKDQLHEFELKLAMIVNGPWDASDYIKDTRFTIDQLRETRWGITDAPTKAILLYGIRALIKSLRNDPELMAMLLSQTKGK